MFLVSFANFCRGFYFGGWAFESSLGLVSVVFVVSLFVRFALGELATRGRMWIYARTESRKCVLAFAVLASALDFFSRGWVFATLGASPPTGKTYSFPMGLLLRDTELEQLYASQFFFWAFLTLPTLAWYNWFSPPGLWMVVVGYSAFFLIVAFGQRIDSVGFVKAIFPRSYSLETSFLVFMLVALAFWVFYLFSCMFDFWESGNVFPIVGGNAAVAGDRAAYEIWYRERVRDLHLIVRLSGVCLFVCGLYGFR